MWTGPEELKRLVESALPGARAVVRDMTGGGDHFEIEVVSERFEGLGLVDRHRMLHRILEGPMESDVHAVKFRAWTPAEKESRHGKERHPRPDRP